MGCSRMEVSSFVMASCKDVERDRWRPLPLAPMDQQSVVQARTEIAGSLY